MQTRETLIDITKMVLRRRKSILRNMAITGVIAVVFCLFMKNYYQATTIFYPASPDIMKPEFVFGGGTKDIEYYGTSVDLDRILTVGSSAALFDFMIDSFDLYKKYDIDSSGVKSRHKVSKRFNEFYTISKTKLDAIELSIEDTDPKMAAAMTNAARVKINDLVSLMLKNNLVQLSTTLQNNVAEKQREVDILSDSVALLRGKYSIIDPESQAEALMSKVIGTESSMIRERERLKTMMSLPGVHRDTINRMKAMVAGLESEYKMLTDSNSTSAVNMASFNRGRNIIEVMSTQLRSAKDYLSLYNTRYNQVIGVLKSSNNAIHLVEAAEVPMIKSRPKRSLIVLSVLLATFLFNVIGIVVIESLKDPEWKKLWNE